MLPSLALWLPKILYGEHDPNPCSRNPEEASWALRNEFRGPGRQVTRSATDAPVDYGQGGCQ